MKRVILTTGGTGGHIFPALAVAEELKKMAPIQLLFVGSNYGPEGELATKADLEFVGLNVRGFLGRGVQGIAAGFNMLKAIVQATNIMRKFKPNAVIGFGGYAAFAPIMSAQLLGINTAIHEQNAMAGVSNKIQGRFAKKIFIGMPEVIGLDVKKCIYTGNPVRQAVVDVFNDKKDFTTKRLLVVGGSQGAKALNDFIVANYNKFQEQNISVMHQCGAKDFERVKQAYMQAQLPTNQLFAFIDDMAAAYAWSDLVLCRSGASTVAELAAAGRAAVFVPFPFATHDHQTHNAKLLVSQGAATMHAEKDLYVQDVIGNVLDLISNTVKLQEMSKAARAVHMGNAAKNIVDNLFI